LSIKTQRPAKPAQQKETLSQEANKPTQTKKERKRGDVYTFLRHLCTPAATPYSQEKKETQNFVVMVITRRFLVRTKKERREKGLKHGKI